VLCATHDTASAVEGMRIGLNQPYISSGTWSLLGIKRNEPLTDENSFSSNFSNEGGIGYIRYQKNIMGMWLIQELRKELCPDKSFDEIVEMAESSKFNELIDADAEILLSPISMKSAFDSLLNSENKLSSADYFRCAYRSLAESYSKAVIQLEKNTGMKFNRIYIAGGGAKNNFLNKLTRKATGKKIIVIPEESTAIVNLKIQMEVAL